MTASFTIQRATVNDAHEIAVMVGELLNEIMSAIGISFFNFSLDETTARLIDFIVREKYYVFVARSRSLSPAGFIALYESYALYAEGAFGTIPELYVRPAHRTNKLGLSSCVSSQSLSVRRVVGHVLESRPAAAPQFDRTLAYL